MLVVRDPGLGARGQRRTAWQQIDNRQSAINHCQSTIPKLEAGSWKQGAPLEIKPFCFPPPNVTSNMQPLRSPVDIAACLRRNPHVINQRDGLPSVRRGPRRPFRQRVIELTAEISGLAQEIGDLTAEIAHLRERNQNLEDAAGLWIDLYERQLLRANDFARQLGDVEGEAG